MPTERQRRRRCRLRNSLKMENLPDRSAEETSQQDSASNYGLAANTKQPAIEGMDGNCWTPISNDQCQERKKLLKQYSSPAVHYQPIPKGKFVGGPSSCASTEGKLMTASASTSQKQRYASKFRSYSSSMSLDSEKRFPGLQEVPGPSSEIGQPNSKTTNSEASTIVIGDTSDEAEMDCLLRESWQYTTTSLGEKMEEDRGLHFTQKNQETKSPLNESLSTAPVSAIQRKQLTPTAPEEPAPGMYVIPVRSVNMTDVQTQFDIQVFNIPKGVILTSKMFEATAESPSGIHIPCFFRNPKVSPTPIGIPPMIKKFQGMFKASKEAGLYWLKVRLILPIALCNNPKSPGVLYDVSSILVSKNYFRDGMKVSDIAYQLPFDHQNPQDRTGKGLNTNAWGLACDKVTNSLYYTERVSNKVTCMDPINGKILFHFRNEGVNSFSHPSGISVDEVHRRVLVCDKNNHRISSFTMDGEYIGSVGGQGVQTGKLNFPWDVAVSPHGTYFAVSDSKNKRIQLFDRFGNSINTFSLFERNTFTYRHVFDSPRGIAFNHNGQLIYTTDFSTQNIVEIPVDMSTYRKLDCADGFLRRPQGLVVDEAGTVLVADSKSNCVRHITPEGRHIGTVRFIGGNHLEQPVNLAFLSTSNVALLDARGRIFII